MNGNTRLRQDSIRKTLSILRERGSLSKRELQELTGFSWGSVSSIIMLLLSERFITTVGKLDTGVGRRPEIFDINDKDRYIIGVDFNLRGASAVLCDLRGRITGSLIRPLKSGGVEGAFACLYSAVEQLISAAGGKTVMAVSAAVQGALDRESGVSLRIEGIEGWQNVPLAGLLSERFRLPAYIYHDPDCLLYSERFSGILGPDTDNALLLRIDHGVGLAALHGGEPLLGSRGAAAEIGGVYVPSPSGGVARLESLICEPAIEKRYFALSGESLPFLEIAKLSTIGHAKAVLSEAGDALAYAIADASALLCPETVVLFGEVPRSAGCFVERTRDTLSRLLPSAPKIRLSGQNSFAAAVGAALFASEKVISNLAL